MKHRILAGLIALCVVSGVTGCGDDSGTSVPSTASSVMESFVEQTNEEPSEMNEMESMEIGNNEEPSESNEMESKEIDNNQENSKSAAVSLRNQTFTKVSPFSEGRAWVEYLGDNRETVISVINTNGEIVFTLDREVDYYYDFHDGYAYYLYTPDQTKGREEYLDNVAFCIVDRDGNVTYNSEQDNIRVVLAYGDGYFLAIEHESTFDVDEWRFGGIDKDGNTVIDFDSYDNNKTVYLPLYRSWYDNGYSFRDSFAYLGEGIFYLYSGNRGKLYNVREKKVIDDYATGTKVGCYSNGYMLYSGNGNSWGIYILDANGNRVELDGRSNFDKSKIFLSGFSEDMCFYDHAYYDTRQNIKIDFSKYADKKIAGGMFTQGFAPLYIEGADGKNYFTIIDSQGNELLAPTPGSPVNSFGEGYLVVQLDSGCALYNTGGEIVLETPYNVISTMASENAWLGGWYCNDSSFVVSDGYFIACKDGSRIPTIFVGVDGSNIGQ